MPADRVNDAVRAVAHFMLADASFGETLQRIAELARDALGPSAACGLTLVDEFEHPVTAVFTDGLAPAIDESQYVEGTGPCLEAYRTGQVVRVDDTSQVDHRWPAFSRAASRHGIYSTLSFPLGAAGARFGALNLYATEVGVYDAQDEADGALFATQASVVLVNARAYWDASDLAAGLQHAMESRAVIEQAKGKIMAGNGCTPDEAFEILVRASQRENVKLRDLARRLVEGNELTT